jgi:excinuclease UvrABC helicase subunit UvrB
MEKFNSSELANLVMILKIFNDQPHNLAHFLMENGAITSSFRKKLKDSQSLSRITKDGFDFENLHFSSIEEMKNYYESLLDNESGSYDDIINDLTEKLKRALLFEDYEAAIRYRDHLKKIKKKK